MARSTGPANAAARNARRGGSRGHANYRSGYSTYGVGGFEQSIVSIANAPRDGSAHYANRSHSRGYASGYGHHDGYSRRHHRPYVRSYRRSDYSPFHYYRSHHGYARLYNHGFLDAAVYLNPFGYYGYYGSYRYSPYSGYGTAITVYNVEPQVETVYRETVYYPVESDATTSYAPVEVIVAPQPTAELPAPEILPQVQGDGATANVSPRAEGAFAGATDLPLAPLEADAVVDGSARPAGTATDPYGMLDAGHRLFADGKYDDARRQYFNAVTVNEADGFAALFFGISNYAMGHYQLAATSIRKALEVSPELIDNPIDIRSIYPDRETFERHRVALRKHLAKNGGSPDDRLLDAYLDFASGEPDAALEGFKRLAAAVPADALAVRLRDAATRIVETPSKVP